MARTILVKTVALGPFGSYTANAADLTMAAADLGGDKNRFLASNNDLVIAHNTGGSARTVTITSSSDPFGRTGDITAYSIGIGEYAVFGPFCLTGWVQTDGYVWLEANNAEVKFGVVDLQIMDKQ